MKIDKLSLKTITINMALRHPEALIYTKDFINNGYMEEIDEDINKYLYENFGLDFSYLDYITVDGEPIEVIKYVEDIEMFNYISISKIPIYDDIGKHKVRVLPKEDTEIKVIPIKLLPEGKTKGGLKLISIDDKMFKLYDSINHISDKSVYSLDKTSNAKTDNKRKTEILHTCISKKQWEELIDFI